MYDVDTISRTNKDIKKIVIELEDSDLTSLFIKFLNTLISESDINSLAFYDFSLKIEGQKLFFVRQWDILLIDGVQVWRLREQHIVRPG